MTILKEAWEKNVVASKNSTWRAIVSLVIWFGCVFTLLFAGAETFAWPEAWLYVLIQISSAAIIGSWLKKHNPALLKVRTEFWKRVTKPWDRAGVIIFVIAALPFFLIPGLDAIRYQWSHVPFGLKMIGFVGIITSSGLSFWVLRTNPYSSAAVEIQRDRGHEVIATPPYQYVRHPMYVGAIVSFLSIPLALGSLIGFVPGIILTALIVVRTYLEDRTLHRELHGYTAYAQEVRFRLIPGVWSIYFG